MSQSLYISDLDGTLLDNNSMVSPDSARIISELTADGALVTVATARTPATVSQLLQSTQTTPPAIVMTGAAMWNRLDGSYSSTAYMKRQSAVRLLSEFSAERIDPFVYTLASPTAVLEVFHSFEMNHKEREFYEQRCRLPLKRFHIGRQVGESELDHVVLAFAIGPTENIDRISRRLNALGQWSVSSYPDIFDSQSSLIEVFAPRVSKAEASLRLKEMTRADRLVVFGDNLNDLPMFEIADVAVAVENAQPEVKEKADIIIGPNSAGSVARFIEKDYCR